MSPDATNACIRCFLPKLMFKEWLLILGASQFYEWIGKTHLDAAGESMFERC